VIAAHESAKLTNCKIHINIMDEPWNRERNKYYQDFFTKHGISSYVHPIHDVGEGRLPYPVKKTNKVNFA
jgi:hypothetical protein